MSEKTNKPHLTIIILVDALGWDVAQEFGFCRDLLPRSGPLDTVLGYSSAAIPSLLSGTSPSMHGAWAMYRYAPSESPYKLLRYLPELPHPMEWRLRALTRRFMAWRKTVKGYHDLYEIPLKLLGHFDVAQRGDPYTPGGMSKETFIDHFATAGIRFVSWTYRTPETDNFEALSEAVDSDSQVLFLYTAELDALMHRLGTHHTDVGEKLRYYESRVRGALEAASRVGREVTVFVFSDHGMTNVKKIIDLKAKVDDWGVAKRRDTVAFYDSTMGRFWCDPLVRAELTERLNATGWGRVLSDSELEELGCRFEDHSYGDLIFLADPGNLIVPSFMGKEPLAAMHGYHPNDSHSRGCFFTNHASCPLPESILDIKDAMVEHVMENS
ncbi:MAG: alkaline phosphatase family protein [Candidatus Latescibacterota bacterium]|nr:MAG: alkaline phosphatase family protein [Candidatus Latescibacterota bacterium]